MKISPLPFLASRHRVTDSADQAYRRRLIMGSVALCFLLPFRPTKALASAQAEASPSTPLAEKFSVLRDKAANFQTILAQNKPRPQATTTPAQMPNMPAPSAAPSTGAAMPMPSTPAAAPMAPMGMMDKMEDMMGKMDRMMGMMDKTMPMADQAPMPPGGMKMGMDMMEMDKMRMMGMMGMKDKDPMPGMETSALPGFPGASHIYHLGATDFFLDHSTHITLTTEQQVALNKLKEQALLAKASSGRQIEQAEQELWTLTAADKPDLAKIEAKAREIEKLNADVRIAFIKAVGNAALVLTDVQRKALTGFAAPSPAPQASPAMPMTAPGGTTMPAPATASPTPMAPMKDM